MKISIFTLGCKVNQYESERIKDLLVQNGHEVSQKLCKADCYIINTCAVTNEGEKKSRQAVSRALRFNEKASVYVIGCASENNSEQFKKRQNVKYCLGNKSKQEIVNMIELDYKYSGDFDADEKEFNDNLYSLLKTDSKYTCENTRTHLKIQDGCNNFCSYCLIPYLRKRSRSRKLESVISEAKKISLFSKEIVLVGIDLSDYNDSGKNLIDLVKILDENNVRIRLGSLEAKIITEENLKTLSTCKNFAEHFHLSLQSGSDKILKLMNRHYTFMEYYQKILLIRKYFPNAGITTDLIVGFPQEDEIDALTTLKNVEKAEFSHIHIFEYSKRNRTKAASMVQCDKSLVKERLKKLHALNERLTSSFLKKQIGLKNQIVLIEEIKNGYHCGFTGNYTKVYLKSDDNNLIGNFVKVDIISLFKDGLLGTYQKKC